MCRMITTGLYSTVLIIVPLLEYTWSFALLQGT